MKSLFAILTFLLGASRLAADFYVSPSGSDTNSGTLSSPFATIDKARLAVASQISGSGIPAGGLTVWLRAGTYNRTSSFTLYSTDSGTAGSPVTYSAYPGEQVFITGAATLSSSGFALVNSGSPVWSRLDPSAQGNLYSMSLPAQGITNYGTLKPGGFNLSVVAPLELFCNRQPMALGRWPSAGQPLADTIAVNSSTQFTYLGTRPSRWTQAQDVWVHGLWNTTWADFELDVGSINTSAKTITVDTAPNMGIGPDETFYAYNLLEEITGPGEYYVDRVAGILYFWPPAPLASSTLQVSMLEAPLVKLDSATHVSFRNLTFEATRGPLLQINGGSYNSFVGCLFRNCGQYAANINGSDNGLDQCEIADSGEDGVILGGGNRATLAAGNNYVTNCRIHRCGRISWGYHPAINFLDSCGNDASNNWIDELPHVAILVVGNNHTIEGNEISRVCQFTSDAGAIYSGRDWGYRGNIISGNFIHHIQNSPEGVNTHGIFLDDLMSSAEVTGNVFYDISGAAIECGAGRDNIMTNNIIAQCGIGHFNGDYARSFVDNTPGDSFNLLQRLADDGIEYQANPWATAYPACAAIPNSFATIETGLWRNPQGCIFSNNAGWSNTNWTLQSDVSGTGVFSVYAAMANNNSSQAPLFDEAQSWDRSLRPSELTAAVTGFTPIAFSTIGPSIASSSSINQLPPVPALQVLSFTNNQAQFQWTDDGIHPEQQETGFEVQQENEPGGTWAAVQEYGPDVDFSTITGLAPATTYGFRVRSFNTMGSVYSNVVTVVTGAPTPVLGSSTVTSAAGSETAVQNDLNNSVNLTQATSIVGPGITLFTVADSIDVTFTSGAGQYNLAVLSRCGYSAYPTYYWPSGYQYILDGNPITFVGDPTSISALDPDDGGCYWGTMNSGLITLVAGTHTLKITAEVQYAIVVTLTLTQLGPPQITTFGQWQQANFTADQLTEAAVSAWSSSAVNDGFTNLLKYALGLKPWTTETGTGVQTTLVSGEPQLSFTAPVGLTDVSYFVEESDDQITWTAIPQTVISQSNGVSTIQATATGTAQQFIRLRVTSGTWTTTTAGIATGAVNVVSAYSPLTVVADMHILGTVEACWDKQYNFEAVPIFDSGDAIKMTFVSSTGNYVLAAFVRSGDNASTATFWLYNGYIFTLDGHPVSFVGDVSTISPRDSSSFGPVYWGMMYTSKMALSAGTHTLVVTSARNWGIVVNAQVINSP